MSEYRDDDYAQDNLRDAEPASYSSETPHFDGLFARYDVGNGYVARALTQTAFAFV